MSEPQDMTPKQVTARPLEFARIVRGNGPNADLLAAIVEDNALAGHRSRAKASKAIASNVSGRRRAPPLA